MTACGACAWRRSCSRASATIPAASRAVLRNQWSSFSPNVPSVHLPGNAHSPDAVSTRSPGRSRSASPSRTCLGPVLTSTSAGVTRLCRLPICAHLHRGSTRDRGRLDDPLRRRRDGLRRGVPARRCCCSLSGHSRTALRSGRLRYPLSSCRARREHLMSRLRYSFTAAAERCLPSHVPWATPGDAVTTLPRNSLVPRTSRRTRRADATTCRMALAGTLPESPPTPPGVRAQSGRGSSTCCPSPRRHDC